MAYDNNNSYGNNGNNFENRNSDSLFSRRIKAGKRRTYFFDVRATRGNDYFITITESKKRFDDGGYDRHKMFLYKEDFNKFLVALEETIGYVKTELMPDFDFDAFNHDQEQPYEPVQEQSYEPAVQEVQEPQPTFNDASGIDDWKM